MFERKHNLSQILFPYSMHMSVPNAVIPLGRDIHGSLNKNHGNQEPHIHRHYPWGGYRTTDVCCTLWWRSFTVVRQRRDFRRLQGSPYVSRWNIFRFVLEDGPKQGLYVHDPSCYSHNLCSGRTCSRNPLESEKSSSKRYILREIAFCSHYTPQGHYLKQAYEEIKYEDEVFALCIMWWS